MSHHTVTQSAPGTPLQDRTVGELVAERPNRSRVFQTYKIDFCCQGGRSVREACERKDIPLDEVLTALEAIDASPAASGPNPSNLAPAELVDYIIKTHHNYLREELPRIHAMALRVARAHGGHTPSVIELAQVFEALCRELEVHVTKEEDDLFPAILALTKDGTASDSLKAEITELSRLHDETGEALQLLRKLTDDFQPPAHACNTWRALFAGLLELDDDLHRHIHLENNVLFPAVEKLTQSAA